MSTQQLYDRTSCVPSVKRMTNTVEKYENIDSYVEIAEGIFEVGE